MRERGADSLVREKYKSQGFMIFLILRQEFLKKSGPLCTPNKFCATQHPHMQSHETTD